MAGNGLVVSAVGDYGHELQFGVFVTPRARRPTGSSRWRPSPTRWGSTSSCRGPPVPAAPTSTPGRCSRSSPPGRAASGSARTAELFPPGPSPALIARAVASLDVLERWPRRAGARRGRLLGSIEATAPPAAPRAERRRAGGGDRRDPPALGHGAAGEGAVRRRRDTTAWLGAGPAARRRCTTSGSGACASKSRMLELTGPQGRRLAAQPPSYLAARRPGSGQRRGRRTYVRPAASRAAIRRLLNIGPLRRPAGSTGSSQVARARGRDRHVHPDRRRSRLPSEQFGVDGRPGGARAGHRGAQRTSGAPPTAAAAAETGRLRRDLTPDDGVRVAATAPWDEAARPQRPGVAARPHVHPARPARRPAPDRRPRHAAERAGAAPRDPRPGARRLGHRRRRALGAGTSWRPPERLDAGRVLLPLPRRSRSTTASRTTRSSSAPCAATRRSRP